MAPDPVERNIYKMTAQERKDANITELPGSLSEAIKDLNDDEVIKNALGSYFVNKFTALKQQEINDYRTNVTDWEHKQYFDD